MSAILNAPRVQSGIGEGFDPETPSMQRGSSVQLPKGYPRSSTVANRRGCAFSVWEESTTRILDLTPALSTCLSTVAVLDVQST